ncbi:hypothetical protein [Thiocystis violacea]|uniref:hypothetical protein n=1 Tax=Thiocystis violacea TaxID=13725 RepID=UPI001904510C|nr:hypothetical protein [Thiocystis violacea]MBK1720674.1 hypothetical protein [Thiocystis violacea]
MLNTTGLSLDQAPPITVPFAFFLAAPFFAMLVGLLLVWQGEAVLASRWSPAALAATHLLALGFLTQIMCGALFQMLPVLAGAPVPGVVPVGRLTQLCLVPGSLALSWGLYAGGRVWLMAGGTALAVGVAVFASAVGIALARARGVPRTLMAMRLALVALVMTLLLGLMLLTALLGAQIPRFSAWVDLHLAWGLLGWAGLLIMGVGYQVVPMFHVTPGYPAWATRAGAPLVIAGLLGATLATGMGRVDAAAWLSLFAAVGLAVFAMVTLSLQRRRERPRIDVTLLYWWTAMLAILASAAAWLLGGRGELVGVLMLLGVGVALPTGMLLKIMPFLSWFHLQHRQVGARRFAVRLPHMQVFIPERAARVQLGVFLAALLCASLAAGLPGHPLAGWLGRTAGAALLVSSALLWWLQLGCYRRYRRIRCQLG